MVSEQFKEDQVALHEPQELVDLLCVPTLEKTIDQFRTGGVSRVIRIIPDPGKDIGFSILSLFHYPRSLNIITCESLAEAERALS